MRNRKFDRDYWRSNEPYREPPEYERRRRDAEYGASEHGRGEDYYDTGESRYGRAPGMFTGADFGRGYGGDYPETFGGHGAYEGAYDRGYGHRGGRTGRENVYQNRGRNYESGYEGDYNPNYPPGNPMTGRGDYYGRERYLESERGYDRRDERGWWDKAADEVSSWLGDEEAERRRRMDAARHGKYRGHGPKNYKRSDERIKDDINDRLTDHAYLDASDIEVEVNEGAVILTGTVDTRYAKRMAEDIAEDVSGVSNVENRLHTTQKRAWVAGMGDINMAGDRSIFTEPEDKAFSKKA